MEETFFPFTLSRSERTITTLVVVSILAAFTGVALGIVLAPSPSGPNSLVITVVVPGLTLLFTGTLLERLARHAPGGCAVGPNAITVLTRKGRAMAVFPLDAIQSAERLDRKAIKGAIRAFGVGGYFGAWGYFWSSKLRTFRGFMTNSDSLVLLRLNQATRRLGFSDNAQIVLSPDDPDSFLECLHTLGVPTGAPTFAIPEAQPRSAR